MYNPNQMRFIYSITLFTFLYSFSVQAQFSYGVKAGVNIDYMVPDKEVLNSAGMSLRLITTSGTGYHIGAFGKLALGEKLFFIPELQFAHRNYTEKTDGSTA